MSWIESHSRLVEHKKIRDAAQELGIKPVEMVGHITVFWHMVIELREDGDISTWTPADIAYYARWEGDPTTFYKAIKNRFIDEKGCKKLVHDWLDYAWKYLYSKYHTNNPKLLDAIKKKHKKTGQPKGQPKGQPLVSLPTNQPTNQPTYQKQKPSAAAAASDISLEVKNAMKAIDADGFNIYQLLNRLKKDSKVGAVIPDTVLLRVCASYWKCRGEIKEAYPWLQRAIVAEWEAWNAEKNVKEGETYKKTPMAASVREVLAGMGGKG